MIPRLLRATLAAAIPSVALSLTFGAAPASAATYSHDDATGDVRGLVLDLVPEEPLNYTRRELERAADITQLRVRHGRNRLIMRLQTVDLTRKSRSEIGPTFLVRTPNRRFEISTFAQSDGRDTTRDVIIQTGRYQRVRCPGLFTDFDFTGDVALVSVPRSCLGDPQNVRIKAVMVRFEQGGPRRSLPSEIIADSAMDDRRFLPFSSTDAIASGPMKAV